MSADSNTDSGKHEYEPKQLFVMRHAERIDNTFGVDWMYRSFDRNGNYKRFDLNMPVEIPARVIENFHLDSPITNTGMFVSNRIGFGLKVNKCVPDIIYSSPSLRCIQSAKGIMLGMGQPHLKIRIEPGLFENTWAHDRLPTFMTPDELDFLELDVDFDYKPYFDINKLCEKCEKMASYNHRVHSTLSKILSKREEIGKDPIILIVAHASTVDLVTGYFKNRIAAANDYADSVSTKVPYCAFVSFEKHPECWRRTNVLPSINYAGFSSEPDFKFLNRA